VLGSLLGLGLPAVAWVPQAARAATPGATIDGSAPVAWDFAPVGGPLGATDSFRLTVKLPGTASRYYAPDVRQGAAHVAVLTVTLTWQGGDPTQALALGAVDSKNTAVGDDAAAATSDGSDIDVFMLQNPGNETYTVTASNFNGTSLSPMAAHAVATLHFTDLAAEPQPRQPQGGLGFDSYHIPLGLMPPTAEEQVVLGGRAFGEPSIGVDPRNDAVMYQAGLYTIRATFDASTRHATPTWANVSAAPFTTTASEDALLDVDRATGRTIVSQLTSVCSLSAVSDDDGATWTPAPKPCETPPAIDHQTIGAGPFAAPLPPGVLYPSAVYYCSQNVAEAECAISLDGGLNYGAAVPMWTSAQCFGLHGHIKVAPDDGTLYVPNKGCGAPECLIVTSTAGPNCHPGFAVSTDNGLSWTVHTIADGHMRYFDTGDPSVGVGAGGTMYFSYGDRDGHPKVAVCTDHGNTCSASIDVGAAFHVRNTEMATLVAGDDNRAAFSFLGSATPGDDQQDRFVGTWHLYVATTYDGGQHWTTVDATPDHPMQRGCIEFNTARCPSTRGTNDQRNLLDFNDMTIDREGRVLVAYTDGCQPDAAPPKGHGSCITDATRLSGLPTEIEAPVIARQSCGLGLYAKYDAMAVPCAAAVAGAAAPPPATAPSPAPRLTNTGGTSASAAVMPILVLLCALLGVGRRRRAGRTS
jgi:hypothetical protein